MPARKGAKSPKLKGQGRKGRSSSKSGAKKRKSSSAKGRSLSPLANSGPVEIDILSRAAMENAYYICHNAVDCLDKRGFTWPGGGGKKKGGKKGKKGKRKKK